MGKRNNFRDPRGHSLRIYDDVYDSAAYAALSPHDVLTYLALLRELRQYNNGDLSLPQTRAKKCGIKHHVTLARCLRALCAVGLIAVTRKGGCNKDGERLPNLFRVTDRECLDIPGKFISAMPVTNEWRRVTSVAHGKQLIAEAEAKAAREAEPVSNAIKAGLERGKKTKALGYTVTVTRTPRDMKSATTRTPRDIDGSQPGHRVTMVEKAENSITTGVCARFDPSEKNEGHRTPCVPPIHSCQTSASFDHSFDLNKTRQLDIETLTDLWASTGCRSNWTHPVQPTSHIQPTAFNLLAA